MRINPLLEGMSPYDPKYIAADTLLSANESPLDVPAPVREEAARRIAGTAFNRYPSPLAGDLREMICANLDQLLLPTLPAGSPSRLRVPSLRASNVIVGNGGDELLFDLFLAWGGPGAKALVCSPTFSVYSLDAAMTQTEVVDVPRRGDFSIDGDALLARLSQGDISLVVLTSPNNPTGDLVDEELLARVLGSTDALVLLDEAYGEFAETTSAHLLPDHPNLAILRTFSKAYSLAGVRLGYMLASEEVISGFLTVRQPYSVDSVSQAIGCAVCANLDAYAASVRATIARRRQLMERLGCINGVETFASSANYIMVRVPNAAEVWRRMVDENSVLVRDFSSSAGLDGCLRISVGTDEENDRMMDALASAIMEAM